MLVHVLPILFFLACVFWQGYAIAYFKFVKDQYYGGETMLPTFVLVVGEMFYYGMYFYFKLF